MHTYCMLVQQPTVFHMEMLRHVQSPYTMRTLTLTFGWFGDTSLSTCVLKSAILADQILTFYKVGMILLVAARPLAPQHKTQNTQQST